MIHELLRPLKPRFNFTLFQVQRKQNNKKKITTRKFSDYISFQDMQSFFEFLVSVINYYHINELHLF